MAEQRGGLSFNARSWRAVKESVLFGEIPYTSDYIEALGVVDCDCQHSCDCHWIPGKESECNCINNGRECDANCPGCVDTRNRNLSDNTQTQTFGLLPSATTRKYLNEQMGDSLVMQQSREAGDTVIGFAGNVMFTKNVPVEHNQYVLALGKWKLRLKKAYRHYAAGTVYSGNFAMDCTKMGTDANFINSTCYNNNAQTYIVVVGGVPKPIVYATEKIKSGLYVFSYMFEIVSL